MINFGNVNEALTEVLREETSLPSDSPAVGGGVNNQIENKFPEQGHWHEFCKSSGFR